MRWTKIVDINIPPKREGLEGIIEEYEDNHQGQQQFSSCGFLLEDCIILSCGVESLRGTNAPMASRFVHVDVVESE